jgi:hypothetical protein
MCRGSAHSFSAANPFRTFLECTSSRKRIANTRDSQVPQIPLWRGSIPSFRFGRRDSARRTNDVVGTALKPCDNKVEEELPTGLDLSL